MNRKLRLLFLPLSLLLLSSLAPAVFHRSSNAMAKQVAGSIHHLSRYFMGKNMSAMAVQGNYAYLALPDGMAILDLSHPSRPRLNGTDFPGSGGRKFWGVVTGRSRLIWQV